MATVGTLNVQVTGSADGPQGLLTVLQRARAGINAFGAAIGKGLLAGGGIAAGLFAGFNRISQSITEIANESAALGLTTEQFTRLKFAAERAGLDMAAMSGAVSNLHRSLIQAGQGEDRAVKALGALNLNAQQLLQLPVEERFSMIAEALSKVGSSADRTDIAMNLFGKSAGDLVGLLAQGGEAFNATLAEADKFGAVLSQDTAVRMQMFQEALHNLAAPFKNIIALVADKMSPFMIALAENLASVAATANASGGGMLRAFRPVIAVLNFVGQVVGGLVGAFNLLQGGIAAIVGLAAKLASHLPGLSAATKQFFQEVATEESRVAKEKFETGARRLTEAFKGEFKFSELLPEAANEFLKRADAIKTDSARRAEEIRGERLRSQLAPSVLAVEDAKEKKAKKRPAIEALERGSVEAQKKIASVLSQDQDLPIQKAQLAEQKKMVQALEKLPENARFLAFAPL